MAATPDVNGPPLPLPAPPTARQPPLARAAGACRLPRLPRVASGGLGAGKQALPASIPRSAAQRVRPRADRLGESLRSCLAITHKCQDFRICVSVRSTLTMPIASVSKGRKRRRKRRKRRNTRKVKGSLEHLDLCFQKITREKKEESHPPDGSSCEQCRSKGSKQPYKERKPSSARGSKKYSSIASNDYTKVSRTLRNLLGRMNTSHSTNVMTVETRRNQEDEKNMTSFQKKTFCTAKRLLSLLLQRDAKVERTRRKTLRKSITKARGNMLLLKRRRVKKQVLPAKGGVL
ncbi:uncharacterized protein [Anas platyrhynchos]|uniref:uncharacterized protein isoform X2 n=1 Tax=Anas platyrhynchos TaxID=8839 RepID=UPI003AF1F42C